MPRTMRQTTPKVLAIEERLEHSTTLMKALELWPQIRTIQDLEHPMYLRLTKADIEGAVPRNPAQCAIALACIREGATGGLISNTVALLIYGTHVKRAIVPAATRAILTGFDMGGQIPENALVSLYAPTRKQRLGEMSRRVGISKSLTHKARGSHHKVKSAPNAGSPKKVMAFRTWGDADLKSQGR